MKKIFIAGISLFLILAVVLFAFRSIRKSQPNPVVEGENTSAPQTSTEPITESTGDIVLNITSPSNNQTVATGSITVTGTTSVGAEVSVNEVDTTADSSGKFGATINLDEGENSIVVVANDSNGNFIEKDLTVIYTPAQ